VCQASGWVGTFYIARKEQEGGGGEVPRLIAEKSKEGGGERVKKAEVERHQTPARTWWAKKKVVGGQGKSGGGQLIAERILTGNHIASQMRSQTIEKMKKNNLGKTYGGRVTDIKATGNLVPCKRKPGRKHGKVLVT